MGKERRKAAEVEKLRLSKEAEERWVGEGSYRHTCSSFVVLPCIVSVSFSGLLSIDDEKLARGSLVLTQRTLKG